jgi:hypothetical protein
VKLQVEAIHGDSDTVSVLDIEGEVSYWLLGGGGAEGVGKVLRSMKDSRHVLSGYWCSPIQ